MTTQTDTATLADRAFAAQLIADARNAGVRWLNDSSHKVLLASIPGVDLTDPEWAHILDRLRRLGLIVLSRCDLVAACPADQRDLLARSCHRSGISEVHCLDLPEERQVVTQYLVELQGQGEDAGRRYVTAVGVDDALEQMAARFPALTAVAVRDQLGKLVKRTRTVA